MTEPPRPGDGPPGSTPDPTSPPPPASYSVPGEADSPGSAPPPSYEAPSYEAPSYGTPSYDAPPPPPGGGYAPPTSGGGYAPPTSGGGYAPPPSAPGGYPPPGGAYGQQPGGYPPPGAYAAGPGGYGPPAGYANNEDKTWALVAHFGGPLGIIVGGGFLGWVAPLIAMMVRGAQSPTVRAHSVAALNFQLTWVIALVASVLLALVSCGLLFFVPLLVALVPIIFGVIAGIKANEGHLYRYPMTISMIK